MAKVSFCVQTWGNTIDYRFLSNLNRLNRPKMKCKRSRLNRRFNRDWRLLSRMNLEIFTLQYLRWIAVVVVGFPLIIVCYSYVLGFRGGYLLVCVVKIHIVQGQAQRLWLILVLFQLAFLLAARSNVVSLVWWDVATKIVFCLKTGWHVGNRKAGHYEKRCSFIYIYIYMCSEWTYECKWRSRLCI